MKAHVRVLFMTGVVCFVLGGGAVWVGRLVTNAASPQAAASSETSEDDKDSQSEKSDQHIKIADRTKSYLVSVTKSNALKVDGSGVTQPVMVVSGAGLRGDLPSNTSSPDLGYPKTLTMCWNADQVTVQESIDGTTWFPSLTTQAAKDTGIMAVGIGCMSVPPARFVRWTSQDYLFQKASGMFQASY
jgi:hypothetical protein